MSFGLETQSIPGDKTPGKECDRHWTGTLSTRGRLPVPATWRKRLCDFWCGKQLNGGTKWPPARLPSWDMNWIVTYPTVGIIQDLHWTTGLFGSILVSCLLRWVWMKIMGRKQDSLLACAQGICSTKTVGDWKDMTYTFWKLMGNCCRNLGKGRRGLKSPFKSARPEQVSTNGFTGKLENHKFWWIRFPFLPWCGFAGSVRGKRSLPNFPNGSGTMRRRTAAWRDIMWDEPTIVRI